MGLFEILCGMNSFALLLYGALLFYDPWQNIEAYDLDPKLKNFDEYHMTCQTLGLQFFLSGITILGAFWCLYDSSPEKKKKFSFCVFVSDVLMSVFYMSCSPQFMNRLNNKIWLGIFISVIFSLSWLFVVFQKGETNCGTEKVKEEKNQEEKIED